jgi:hypothetical protein
LSDNRKRQQRRQLWFDSHFVHSRVPVSARPEWLACGSVDGMLGGSESLSNQNLASWRVWRVCRTTRPGQRAAGHQRANVNGARWTEATWLG